MMEITDEIRNQVAALDALAHEVRLRVFRLLVPAGWRGLPAGAISEELGLPPNSLSFHLNRLNQAGLLVARREGRHLYYSVNYAGIAGLVEFLAGQCCAAAPDGCLPGCPDVMPRPIGAVAPDGSPVKATKRN